MGSSWIVVGPTGSGSVTKLANQIMVNVNICAVAEALVLAQKAGADPKKVFEAVRCGLAGSTVLETKAPKMFNRDFKAGGTIKVNLKDITNVMNTARDLQVPLFLSGIVQQIQLSLKQSGHIMDDHAATFSSTNRIPVSLSKRKKNKKCRRGDYHGESIKRRIIQYPSGCTGE